MIKPHVWWGKTLTAQMFCERGHLWTITGPDCAAKGSLWFPGKMGLGWTPEKLGSGNLWNPRSVLENRPQDLGHEITLRQDGFSLFTWSHPWKCWESPCFFRPKCGGRRPFVKGPPGISRKRPLSSEAKACFPPPVNVWTFREGV